MTSYFKLQRDIHYRNRSTALTLSTNQSGYLTFDEGPLYNSLGNYDYVNAPNYANATPWPNAPAVPCDKFPLPTTGPYWISGRVLIYHATASYPTSGQIQIEFWDRTANASFGEIVYPQYVQAVNGDYIGVENMYQWTSDPELNGIAGHEISIKCTNGSNVPIRFGGITTNNMTSYITARELVASPKTVPPVVTTTSDQFITVFRDLAALQLIAGSATITHPDNTVQTYSDTSPTSAFVLQVGDTVVTSSTGYGNIVLENGVSHQVLPNTNYKLQSMLQQLGGYEGVWALQLGQTFDRLDRLADRPSTTVVSSAAYTRDGTNGRAQMGLVKNADGSTTVSVLDGTVTVEKQ